MTKKEYIDYVQKNFTGETKRIVLNQIEHFFESTDTNLAPKNHNYKIGDDVVLNKYSLLHGIALMDKSKKLDIQVFDILAKNGIISASFVMDTSHLVSYAAAFYKIDVRKKLGDYIKEYSGLTFTYDDQYKIVPYGEIDNFIDSMRNVEHFRLNAETTMETLFMPSLARDKNQIAFILNTKNDKYKKLLYNNLTNKNIPVEVINDFIHPNGRVTFDERNKTGHNNRILYAIFGLPPCMIEGILVGRKYEKDNEILKHIKEKLPNCYICNLDGKVIK